MSPLGSYLRSIVCHQRDARITVPTQRDRERERKTTFTADIPYLWSQRRLLLLDDQLSIIQLAHLHTRHRNVVLFS